MTYKRASFGLFAVITAILCFLAILLSTPWGAQLSFYVVKKVTPIQIEYGSGALLNDLKLNQLLIDNEQALIKANDVRLQLHLRCLWKNQLCVDELSIASLQVDVKEENSAPTTAITTKDVAPPASFTLPFTVKMKKFFLGKANLKTQGVEIHVTDFASALSVNKAAINIDKSTLASAHILLSEKSEPPEPVANSPWPLAALPELYSPVKLMLKSLTVKKLTVSEKETTGAENTVLSIVNTIARLSWFKTQLAIEQLSSTVSSVGDLALTGKVNFVSPYMVDLTLVSAIKEFELLPQLNHSNQKTLLQGNLSQLTTTISSKGALAFEAELSVDATDADLPYKLIADVTQFTLPDDITKVVTPSTLFLKSEGDLNRHVIDLNSNISGFGYQNAALEFNAIYEQQTFKINTLHFEDATANSKLNMTGELLLGQRTVWDVKLDSAGFTLPNIDQRLSGRVQGNIHSKGFWQEHEWAVKVVDSAIFGEMNEIKLNAKANVDINHMGQLAPSEIFVDYGDIALVLKGYSDENWHVSGKAQIAKMSNLLADLEGDFSSSFTISGPVKEPEVSLQGQLNNLLFDKLSSDVINVDAQYRPMNQHQHAVAITSAIISWDQHDINDVKLASKGDLNQQQFKLVWAGDSSADLVINSRYEQSTDQWKIQTEKALFALDEHTFEPDNPVDFQYNTIENTLAINQHCWLGVDAKLCLNEDSSLKLAQGTLPLAIQLDSELLKPFLPENLLLDGAIDGNIAIGWQPDSMPSVDATLSISDGDVQINKSGNLHRVLEWQNGQINLTIKNNNMLANVALFTADKTEMLSANTSISFADNRIVESQVTINDFNLSPLQFLAPELTTFEGMLNTKLTVAGDFDKPIINGDLNVTNGKAKILGNINTLEAINMAVNFKGQQGVISGGLNINNAAATLKGEIDWQSELQGQLNFDGELLKFSVPPDLTVTVSPHLIAQINASELKLSGRVEVLEGKLSINKLPQGSVSLSDDVIIVNDEGEQVANEKPFDIFTNIRVVIADAFKVEGQGFVGRLGGELQVSQQPHQPLQLFGSLKIPEGRYRAYGQDLSMTKGNISFNGQVNNPYVSLQATRSIEKENIIVGIDASGFANSLNIKLFSKPVMQQSETLSYLVRGRGLDAETGDSNTAIGVALGTAITNFSGVLTQIEKLPLINRIEIDGDEKQASIAGYLGDKVYIKYGIGIMEPINELTVRFYLLSRLWVETVSGLENSADIYYSFDIK